MRQSLNSLGETGFSQPIASMLSLAKVRLADLSCEACE
jgi:hypothetical protein